MAPADAVFRDVSLTEKPLSIKVKMEGYMPQKRWEITVF